MVAGRDHDWHELMHHAEPADCVPVDATDPLYILYTSGTTGKPKGVVRDNGGHAVALKYSMKTVYNINPGEVFWAASDVGWVVGHRYIVYGPLIHGCSTVLYEGKPVRTPDAGAFWRVIQEYEVSAFFTAPTAFRAIKKEDPDAHLRRKYDISHAAHAVPGGRTAGPADLRVAGPGARCAHRRPLVADRDGLAHRGQPMGLEPHRVKAGSASFPVPGFKVEVLDDEGHRCPPARRATSSSKLPLPPGCLPTLWNDDEGFRDSYLKAFPGYYHTADGGYIDEDGYVFIMGRTDDVINVAGHRLSTGEMEELIGGHPAVAECAVVGIDDQLKGQVPIGLVVLKDGVTWRADGAGGRAGAADPPGDRRGGRLQEGHRGGAAAQDAVGQDPAQDHPAAGGRGADRHAADHRRSGDHRRDPHRAARAPGRASTRTCRWPRTTPRGSEVLSWEFAATGENQWR